MVGATAALGVISPAAAAPDEAVSAEAESAWVAVSPTVRKRVIVDAEIPVFANAQIPAFTCPDDAPYVLDGNHDPDYDVFKGVDVEVPFGVSLALYYSGISADDDFLDGITRLRGWGSDGGNLIYNAIHFNSAHVKVTVYCTSEPNDASRGR